MNRKMATYLRFGPVVALLAIVALVFALLPVGRAGAVLAGIAMTINPNEAGLVAEYQIAFTTDRPLESNTGEIALTFDKDIGFPASISRSSVFITAAAVGPPAVGTVVSGIPGQSVNPPTDPTISVDTVDSRRKTVTIKVPDMDPGTAAPPAGSTGGSSAINNIQPGLVTVTFSQAAGLTNPRAAEISTLGNGRTQIFVLTRSGGVTDPAGGAPGTAPARAVVGGPAEFPAVTPIPRSITLNRVDGSRNQAVTVTGRGYTAGNTATVFLDLGVAGVYVVGVDVDLVQVTVGADSTFTTTISMDSRFAPGANAIGATDGTAEAAPGTINVNTVARSLRLRGKVSVTPTEARRGDAISVTLEDFVVGAAVAELNIGGATMIGVGAGLLPVGTPIEAGGRLSRTVNVPALTPLGIQELKAGTVADDGRSTRITIKGAPMTVSPGTAVPNQSITISGTGFSTGGATPTPCAAAAPGAPVVNLIAAAGGITIGGVGIALPAPICVDNGGNWVVSPPVIVPINATNLTPGTYVVRATDSGGAVGEGTLVIPDRRITMSPISSRQRTTITLTGSGFPANNTQAGADNRTVTINYATPLGGVAAASVTATPDASGKFTVSLTVPTTAGIPSDNTVTVLIPAGLTAATATSTTVHAVPAAAISVKPAKGVPGSSVTVTGENFPTFSTIAANAMTLGGRVVTSSPAPSTDREGSFTASGILVPDLDAGVQSVIVNVGGTTATVGFEITTAPVAPPPPAVVAAVAPATALAPLAANLVRTWGYDAATQKFQLYDPAAALLSDLTALNRGGGYWINVRSAQTATLGTGSYSLSAGWNLIGWLG